MLRTGSGISGKTCSSHDDVYVEMIVEMSSR
jgi:hypothetical protein